MSAPATNEVSESVDISDKAMEYIFRDRMEHLGLMSSALVHELCTPLIIIRGRAESLLRHRDQDSDAALREISEECRNLLKLLDSLAFVSPGGGDLRFQNLAIKDTVEGTLVFFEKSCLERGISLRAEIPECLRVDSEPSRLKSILMSLINNAVESFDRHLGKPVKEILIHSQVDAKQVHLIITDTGGGMANSTQGQLRKSLFFSTKAHHKGSGLGLALSQKMANDLKVQLSFVSQEKQGTTFTISFPKNVHSLESVSDGGS